MQVNEVVGKAHSSLIGKPLFAGDLSEKQWVMLDEMQQELNNEYRMRREMMIKRLDVTVQSFQVRKTMSDSNSVLLITYL